MREGVKQFYFLTYLIIVCYGNSIRLVFVARYIEIWYASILFIGKYLKNQRLMRYKIAITNILLIFAFSMQNAYCLSPELALSSKSV
jgi:hypothetical protein